MPQVTATSIYIFCVFFLASALIESMSFNALSSSEKEILYYRKKLPFMTDLYSIGKVFCVSFLVIYITPWKMQYKTILYSNTQELVFIYHILMVFFVVAFVPVIQYLQRDIQNKKLPHWYLRNILVGDYIHLWGILFACYASIPKF